MAFLHKIEMRFAESSTLGMQNMQGGRHREIVLVLWYSAEVMRGTAGYTGVAPMKT
jgi:hypothetical protein